MHHLIQSKWFILALRLLIGGVFIYAGATKIADPLAFADSIATFEVLPPQLINLVALSLPPSEILAGAMLVFGVDLRTASSALLLLTMAFAVILGQAIVRGLEVDCGCFGSGKPSVFAAWAALGRDIVLMAATAWVWLHTHKAHPDLVMPRQPVLAP